MKIVGISDLAKSATEIVADIIRENALIATDLVYERDFTVELPRRRYKNIIVNCTVEVLKKSIQNGVSLNNMRLRCYEHVSTCVTMPQMLCVWPCCPKV